MNPKNEHTRFDVRDRSGHWVDQAVRRVVEHIASGRWNGEPIGQMADEQGELFTYVLGKRALLSEFSGDFRLGINVRRLCASDSHPMSQLKGVDEFSDDEKQLCVQRAREALCIGKREEFSDAFGQ